MMSTNMRIAVIIPYFQREPGILRKAIQSVLNQSGVVRPHIIVVDDSSPIPASSELAGFLPEFRENIVVIEQPNAGPGGARNTGIEAIPDQFELVAFLDSDDEWCSDHLYNAHEAFHSGGDFYFADHLEYSGEITRFERLGNLGTFRAHDHPRIHNGSSLRWFSGDFVDQLIRDFVVQTATVVVRRSILGQHRFPIEFRRAGEDHLFWIMIAASGAKVVFSEQVECRLGKGVNIYEASGWGTEGAIERAVDYSRLFIQMHNIYAKTEAQKTLISKRIAQARREFIRIMFHDMSRFGLKSAGYIKRQLWNDPFTLAMVFPELFRIVLERIHNKAR